MVCEGGGCVAELCELDTTTVLESMGGTASKESPSGGSDNRGGVRLVPTKYSPAESDDANGDATSTSSRRCRWASRRVGAWTS